MNNAKKICKVIIDNFQSHAHTEVEFGDFSAIIGPTDNGKSAIIRAISWCLYNDRMGDSFVRHGETHCSVRIIFSDNTEIVRARGYKENYYELIDGDKTLHIESFGSGAVEEVINFHNMHPVKLFGDKKIPLNLCKQLEPPFFLTESAPVKAAIIGKLGGVDVVDTALKSINSQIRETKIEVKLLKNELKETKKELKELPNLSQVERAITFIEERSNTIKSIFSKISSIESIYENLNKKIIQHNELYKKICCEEDIENSIKILDLLEDEVRKSNKIKDKINVFFKLTEEKLSLKNFTNIDLNEVEEVINKVLECEEILNKINKINLLLSKYYDLIKKKIFLTKKISGEQDSILAIVNLEQIESMLSSIKFISESIEKYNYQKSRKTKGTSIIKRLEDNYEDNKKVYKKELVAVGHCPLCMSKLDDTVDVEKIL